MTTARSGGGKRNHRIRLLVVSSAWPHVVANFEAANVVCHSIVSELMRSGDFDVTYAFVNSSAVSIPSQAQAEIDALRAGGVEFLDPLLLPVAPRLSRRPWKLLYALFFRPESVLFGSGYGRQMQALVGDRPIDAVLTIWSEVGANIAAELPVQRFAYHGNPDHKVFDAQHEAMRLVGERPRGVFALVDWMRRLLLRHLLERAHLSVLRRFDVVADVAANDAAYYSRKGISACYLQNMWPAVPPVDWETQRDALEAENPNKIVGSVGNTSATGNTLGFITLGQEILPALKRVLPDKSFEVHIFGGNKPKPYIRSLLDDPCVLMRGFVSDLDAEIMSSPIFLISNNHHRFKVGHTRFLHAWSLGACVVAFSDCRHAMPEIEHGRNALLGDTPEEVACLVAEALRDRNLRRKIGRGGVDTLKTKFSPSAVTRSLADQIKKYSLMKVLLGRGLS